MVATPPGLLIEALLLPGDTVPTNEVRAVVIADRFNHVRRLAIAAFTAMSFIVLSGNHDSVRPILPRRYPNPEM
jgi:uncharacterized membrane protein